MAIKKVVEIDIETGDAVKSMTELGGTFEDVFGEIQPLTTEIGEMEDVLHRLALEGKSSTKEFQALAEKVGGFKKIIIDTDLELDGLSTTLSQKVGGAIGGISGGFELGIGAMAAFGVESERVESALLKVQSAMAISQGIQSIREAIPSFKALWGVIVKTAAGQWLLNAAQAAGAIGMRILNAVMNANPVFLLITGITALVGAIILFTSETERAADMQSMLNDKIKKNTKLIDAAINAAKKRGQQDLETLEATGASEEELHDQRLKNLKTEENGRKIKMNQEALNIKFQRNTLNQARKEGNKELAETIANELEQSQTRYDTLVEQNGDYNHAKSIENENFAKEEEARRKEELQKDKANYDKRVAAWKDYQSNRLSTSREIEDLQLALLADGQFKEIEALRINAERRREDTLTNTDLTQTERAELLKLHDRTREAEEQEVRNRYVELERQKEKDAIAARSEASKVAAPEIVSLEEAPEIAEEKIKGEMLFALREEWRQKDEEKNSEYIIRLGEQSKGYFDAVSQGLNAMSDLNDLLTDQAVKKANGNARMEEAARKKGFERSKKLQLVMAVVQGVQGVMAAFTAGSSMGPAGVVMGPVMAAIAAVTAGINIAKIASTKYEGGAGSAGSPAIPQAPNVGAAANFNVVGAGGGNQLAEALGNQAPVQAFVVGSEVTTQQSLDRNKVDNASL